MVNMCENIIQYKELSVKLKDQSFRLSISEGELMQATLHLEETYADIKNTPIISNDHCILALQTLLRCLRNACITCKRNQNILIKTRSLDVTLDILSDSLKEEALLQDTANLKSLQSSCLQFLGNLVTGNQECQEKVWMMIFPKILRILLETLDDGVKDILCMVIFNCIRNRPTVLQEPEFIDIMMSIIAHCKCENAEWGLLIIEDIISSGKLEELYDNMLDNCEQKLVLLDLFLAYLDDENLEIPEHTLLYLSDKFEVSVEKVMLDGNKSQEDASQTAELMLRYLGIFCTATSFLVKYENILRRTKLLEHAVHLLKFLSQKAHESKLQRDASSSSYTNGNEAVCGLKRDLVRLIGNMCYDNKNCQDQVRHLDGIQAILDNCRIEDKNPYICQWAVFAVRNLCKNNTENQLLISGFERQGVVNDDALRREGFNVRIENDRIRVKVEKTQSNEPSK